MASRDMPPRPNTFYFLHQIKLQTLPYVQKQITHFIQYFSDHLSLQHYAKNQQQKQQWHKKTKTIFTILQKKLQQIQNFHYHNWMDYRANLVLRSKKLLIQFYQTHKNLLSSFNSKSANNNNFLSQNMSENVLKRYNHDERILQEQQNSPQKDALKYQQIKDSVNKIKTQMGQKTSKQILNIKNVKKFQTKQTKKGKNQIINISKQEITKQISKIIDKSSSSQKLKTNLVFASRRANEQKDHNKKKYKSNILQNTNNQVSAKNLSSSKQKNLSSRQKQKVQYQFQGSVQKQISKSVEKDGYSINKSKQKSTAKHVATKKTQAKIGKKVTKEDEKQKKPQTVTKNMTKEEYIQYLINKNKMNISTTNF